MIKYRIIITSMPYPYTVQRKTSWFSFWENIDHKSTAELAEHALMAHIKDNIPAVGTVIKTYDEVDLVADILKGKV